MTKITAGWSRAREFADQKQRGIALARQVSTVLKRAGFVKAGPYKVFGTRDPGYLVEESGNGTNEVPTAVAFFLGNFQDRVDEAVEALRADGRFEVVIEGKDPKVTKRSFDSRTLRVTRKEAD